MGYADKAKQRAFQREWQRKKTAAAGGRPERHGHGFIRPEQVVAAGVVAEAATWIDCVEAAKKLVPVGGIKVNRLALAELALRACEIQHGGKHDPERMTIKRFALAIGAHSKTLNDWCTITKTLIHKLPPEELAKGVDFTAAKTALEQNRHGTFEQILACYRDLASWESAARRSFRLTRIARSVMYNLQKIDIKRLPAADKTMLEEMACAVLEALGSDLHE